MVETGKNQAHVGVAICKVTLSLKWGGHVMDPPFISRKTFANRSHRVQY
jgi:hypothetical protein